MKGIRYASLIACALLVLGSASNSSAVVLVSDDFTVAGLTSDVNENLSNRQSGLLGSFTYTADGFGFDNNPTVHELGNTTVNVGQPGGASNGNYLLMDMSAYVLSDETIGQSIARGAPLTISFDMYVTGNPNGVEADQWGAFTLRAGGQGWPVADAGEFGMLMRNDGRIQMFQNSSTANPAWENLGYSTDSRWELTFSDTAGTGSAFSGNGSMLRMVNGANDETVTLNQLNSTGLRIGFRNFQALAMGVDNLLIDGVNRVQGDADGNGIVQTADFFLISNNFYSTPATVGAVNSGDVNWDGIVNEADFRDWRIGFGEDAADAFLASLSVPEPATAGMIALGCLVAAGAARRRR
ncbi:MAG: PEP-CTERM sorting domain-containing protein [Planctomycetales bacterium]|nr:PEP-CTERM sorting domain-containing protein [Planctomycetales bacterium]